MMKKTVLFLLLCMAAAPGLSQTLTLDECRAAAEEHNRTLKNSRLDLDAALQTRREAFTTYFPQVSASGGVFQAQHGLVQADFAIPQMESLPLSLVKRGILGSVTAVQPLFAGLKIVSGNKLARLGEEVAQLQLQKTAAEVLERTDTYFWQVVSLRDNLSTIEAVERQLAEIHRQVALSVKAGLVTTNDLLRVELRRQEVASKRLKVENGLKVSKMLLAAYRRRLAYVRHRGRSLRRTGGPGSLLRAGGRGARPPRGIPALGKERRGAEIPQTHGTRQTAADRGRGRRVPLL